MKKGKGETGILAELEAEQLNELKKDHYLAKLAPDRSPGATKAIARNVRTSNHLKHVRCKKRFRTVFRAESFRLRDYHAVTGHSANGA